MRKIITAITIATTAGALSLAACSHSTPSSGATTPSTAPGETAPAGTVTADSSRDATSSGDDTGTIAPDGPGRTFPTTSAPTQSVWVKDHAADLRALHTALDGVTAAFGTSDNEVLSTSLIACTNATTPLVRTAAGSLPTAQADALATIADRCASMAHMVKSGDTAGLEAARPTLDAAAATIAPVFAAAGA